MSSESAKDGADEPKLMTLKVLPMLKERQQQHGLRHGDFQRYHGYCSRRLRRLRETLRMPQGDRRHFKKKDITLNDLDSLKADYRYLEIPLTLTERAWACAMQLKQEANTESRKRFHMLRRVGKSVRLGQNLLALALASDKVDARTKLECEAYVAFINASSHFEMQEWQEAMDEFKKAQGIYSQIAQALGESAEANVYTEKITELLPTMRFCAYQTGAELKISELASEFQSAAIAKMIAQKPKMSEVTFRNQKITVPNEKTVALLVRIEELEKKEEKKVDMYEDVLVDLRDAIQSARDAVKEQTTPTMLLSYLLYLRLKVTNERTEIMILERRQPKDCIRFVEMILHNLNEMKPITGLDTDDDFQTEVDDEILVYKGVRCRYLADVYKSLKKWDEAMALYERCDEYFKQAVKSLPTKSMSMKKLRETKTYIESAAVECHAQGILSKAREEGAGDDTVKLCRPEKPLSERLDEYVLDESLVNGEPNLVNFPDFRPVPCKPLFFDLALNHVQFPSELEEKAGISPKKSPTKEGGAGITGFVKGLWGWGK